MRWFVSEIIANRIKNQIKFKYSIAIQSFEAMRSGKRQRRDGLQFIKNRILSLFLLELQAEQAGTTPAFPIIISALSDRLALPWIFPSRYQIQQCEPSILHSTINMLITRRLLGLLPRRLPLLGLLPRAAFSRPKLTKQQIQDSTQQQLIDKLSQLYNYKQYKIPSALGLLQVHHQYRVFRAGDWVLDVGAGPHYAWTDLALKLTHAADYSHKVISCDLRDGTQKMNHVHVTGNFVEEPVKTKIAMNLVDRQLDVIMIDATPEYSGDLSHDSEHGVKVLVAALEFAQFYLKKGGTVVMRVLESPVTEKLEQQCSIFFNEIYKYRSPSFRVNSASVYYVLRGYMMTENYESLAKFLKQYGKCRNSYSKAKLVEKYQGRYNWDPQQMVHSQAVQKIRKLKQSGVKNREILKIYQDDPYVKADKIVQLYNILDDSQAVPQMKAKASNQLRGIKDELVDSLPTNQQQFTEYLIKEAEKQAKRLKEVTQFNESKRSKRRHPNQTARPKLKSQSRAPLADNETYMKSTVSTMEQASFSYKDLSYLEDDLLGYNKDQPDYSINRSIAKNPKYQLEEDLAEMRKLIETYPQIREAFEKNEQEDGNELDPYQAYKNSRQAMNQEMHAVHRQPNPAPSSRQTQADQQIDQDIKQLNKIRQKQQQAKTNPNKRGGRGSSTLDRELNTQEDDGYYKGQDMEWMSRKTERIMRDRQQEMDQKQIDNELRQEYIDSMPGKQEMPVNSRRNRKETGEYFGSSRHRRRNR